MASRKRTIIWCGVGLVAAVMAVIVACDIVVSHNADGRMYNSVDDMPEREVGLLLGTSPFWGNHYRNFYFENRIKATADLYHAGKVKKLIVSGGDYRKNDGYDEPVAMRDSLVAHGVPADIITLDYDGTRTLNSIAKVKDVYGSDSIAIISQEYHNERALYQADYVGVDAIAYNAVTPKKLSKLIKNRGREYFARVKLFIDIARGVKPTYDSQNRILAKHEFGIYKNMHYLCQQTC